MTAKKKGEKDELRSRLTPEQFHVTQEKGTELAFSGKYHDCKTPGMYACNCCGVELFDSSFLGLVPNGTYLSFFGWPFFKTSILAIGLGFMSNGNGFARRLTALGSILPGLLPTVCCDMSRNRSMY